MKSRRSRHIAWREAAPSPTWAGLVRSAGELDSGVVTATLVRADHRRNDGAESRTDEITEEPEHRLAGGCAIPDLNYRAARVVRSAGELGFRSGDGDARADRPPPE